MERPHKVTLTFKCIGCRAERQFRGTVSSACRWIDAIQWRRLGGSAPAGLAWINRIPAACATCDGTSAILDGFMREVAS